jgi:hypothetical protein
MPREVIGVAMRHERPWFRIPRVEPEVAFGQVKPALESHFDHLAASLATPPWHATPNPMPGNAGGPLPLRDQTAFSGFGSNMNRITAITRTTKESAENSKPQTVVTKAVEMSPAKASGSASPVWDNSPKAPTMPTTVPPNPINGGINTPAIEIQIIRSQNLLCLALRLLLPACWAAGGVV